MYHFHGNAEGGFRKLCVPGENSGCAPVVAIHRLMTLEVMAVRMRNEIISNIFPLAFFTSYSRLRFSARLNEFNETT